MRLLFPRLLIFVFFNVAGFYGFGQHIIKLSIQDCSNNEPLAGVSVQLQKKPGSFAISDKSGLAAISFDKDTANLVLTYTGFQELLVAISSSDTTRDICLTPLNESLQNVTVVSSTRTGDPVETATTKVEVLGLEEMNEESTLKPGNIASILGDMSGIQIQQSSVASGNSNVRIQGLDGKYTQILRDGMPLYEGYAGGFGILTIPPLDLKQIELIKGSASTLYGGGAIGGLINLVSKKPAYSPELSMLINQSTLNETNVNAYYAQRSKKLGVSFFAGQNWQQKKDVNKDGFSDLPEMSSLLLHPTIFIYPGNRTSIFLSWSGSFDNRKGGDMQVLNGKADAVHDYFEENVLQRHTLSLQAEQKFNSQYSLEAKGSVSLFKREQTTNTDVFIGRQQNIYTEAAFHGHFSRHQLVAGVNVTADRFEPDTATPAPINKISNTTIGAFAQESWRITNQTKLETGIRFDHHQQYGNFVLPRIALFHHISDNWGTRLGLGMGYKTPNPLSPQIKDYSIYDIQPIDAAVTAEKSLGVNAEINYRKDIGDESHFFINQAFFLTRIGQPIVGMENAMGKLSFQNEQRPIVTQGFDTYVQASLGDWELYLGYTYTDARRKYLDDHQFMWLTPKHRAAFVLAYEIEDQWRFGLEGSYTGHQYREDYTSTPGYVFIAAMIEKKFGPKWSLVVNGENLLDERQSKYEALYTGTISQPVFKSLWAPIDGRVLNVCVRFKPFEKHKS